MLAHSFCSVEAEICFSKHVPDLKTCGFEDVLFSNHGPDSCKHGGVLTHSFCFVGGVSVFPTAALTPPPFLNGLPSERWWPQRRVWKSKYSCSTKRKGVCQHTAVLAQIRAAFGKTHLQLHASSNRASKLNAAMSATLSHTTDTRMHKNCKWRCNDHDIISTN